MATIRPSTADFPQPGLHLGDMLDQLQGLGLLTWRWDYDNTNSAAIYWIAETGKSRRNLGTRQAEKVAARLCAQQGIVWLPVPHPGNEALRDKTLRRVHLIDLRPAGRYQRGEHTLGRGLACAGRTAGCDVLSCSDNSVNYGALSMVANQWMNLERILMQTLKDMSACGLRVAAPRGCGK